MEPWRKRTENNVRSDGHLPTLHDRFPRVDLEGSSFLGSTLSLRRTMSSSGLSCVDWNARTVTSISRGRRVVEPLVPS